MEKFITKFNRFNEQDKIRKWFFILLALGFQIVSFYASFLGIQEMFVAQTSIALVFAIALNLSLLAAWHEFQQNPQTVIEDDGFAKRRSLALLLGASLLCLSAFLSSIGMYTVLGFRTGAETDSTVESNQAVQQTKEIFFKVKDAAAKNLDAQKADLAKKLDAAKKRLAQIKREKYRVGAAEVVRQFEAKLKTVDQEKDKLNSQRPIADENLTLKQRIMEIQTQISNIISDFQVERDLVLSADDKKILTFNSPINRNLYDQLAADIQNKKPLAIASIVFGVAPDFFAVSLMFVSIRRKKLWRRVHDSKTWLVQFGKVFVAPVNLPSAVAIETVVFDENRNPLMQFGLPIDFKQEVSEEHIRHFFPEIIADLVSNFRRNFEIQDLPNNWRETLTAGEPLELTAVEI